MSDQPSKNGESHAAATQVANAVAMQVSVMGAIMGCGTALLVITGGFLLGFFIFWNK